MESELYPQRDELQVVNVWVTEELRTVETLQTDSVYFLEPEMERPTPPLSL